MEKMFEGKSVLVVGGTGTIGTAIVEKILQESPAVVRLYSRDEHKQFMMSQEIGDRKDIRYLIGDVRDKERLNRAMCGVDIVFNLAALKHVPSCEYNPFEAIKTNVIGTQNIIECAIENNIKKVIFTSSDKAVSPTNTMGATKLLAERIMSSANYTKGVVDTIFASVRFGNVMGSRGSVIPLFKQQIIENGAITLTDANMSRFMMSISQAVELTLKACRIAQGGEVFVLKMPVVNLGDFAQVVIDKVTEKYSINKEKIKIEDIGLRPGEKLFEELMSEDEAIRAIELADMYVIPALNANHTYAEQKKASGESYSSKLHDPISKQEISNMLLGDDLI